MRMCDENHFVLEFLQSQGKDFIEMKSSLNVPSTGAGRGGVVTAEEEQQQMKQKLQSLSTIPGYREKNSSVKLVTAPAVEDEEMKLPPPQQELEEEEDTLVVQEQKQIKKLKRSQEPIAVEEKKTSSERRERHDESPLKAKKQKVEGKKSIKKLRANR